jgi:hypothetical protein
VSQRRRYELSTRDTAVRYQFDGVTPHARGNYLTTDTMGGLMLHESDHVVATHDIHGMTGGDIRKGTAGVVIGHRGHDRPIYRVRFTVTPGRTTVLGDLTEYDISRS